MIWVESRRVHVLVEAVESGVVHEGRGAARGMLRFSGHAREVAGGGCSAQGRQ
jgi:hypothetical protein